MSLPSGNRETQGSQVDGLRYACGADACILQRGIFGRRVIQESRNSPFGTLMVDATRTTRSLLAIVEGIAIFFRCGFAAARGKAATSTFLLAFQNMHVTHLVNYAVNTSKTFLTNSVVPWVSFGNR